MKNIIGFTDSAKGSEIEKPETIIEEAKPVRSIVSVQFDNIDRELSYYNDRFDLQPGDRVFVAGRFFGIPGTVTGVSTCFKINTAIYKKVLAKPDTKIKGCFIQVNDKMVSFDTTLTPERFEALVISPPDPDSEDVPGEIVCGEGWSLPLFDFESSDYVSEITIKKAFDYCCEGHVKYLSLNDGTGTAFIEGTHYYRVDFEFDGSDVSGLYCDCPYPEPMLCKHQVAVLITLRMLLMQDELEGKENFTAVDSNFFMNKISSANQKIIFE